MDKRYIELFKEVAHAAEVLAEKVKDAEYDAKTPEADHAADVLYNDFSQLYDKLRAPDLDDTTITRNEFAHLLVGIVIVTGNLENQIKNLQTAVKGYRETISPLLERVFNESEDDASAQKLAQELFIIQTNEESK